MNGLNDKSLVCAALVAAQAEMSSAKFDSKNPFLHNEYASLGSVIDAARPILGKHGLAILQVPAIADGHVALSTTLVHSSGQMLNCGTMSLPLSEVKGLSLSQAAGILITYMRRYAFAPPLALYSEADTDGNDDQTEQRPPPEPAQPLAPAQLIADDPPGSRKKVVIDGLIKGRGAAGVKALEHFLQTKGQLKPEQSLEDWPDALVPKYTNLANKLSKEFGFFFRAQTEAQEQV